MTKSSGNSSFSHGFPGHKTLGKPIEFQWKTVKNHQFVHNFLPRKGNCVSLLSPHPCLFLTKGFARGKFKVNVIGVIHSTNSFLPLLRKGSTKKIVTISTGAGDRDFVFKTNLSSMIAYSASKAATNMIITKYVVQFKDKGLIFVALSPGIVDTLATGQGECYHFTDELCILYRVPAASAKNAKFRNSVDTT
jgi:hypothetical protein